MTDPSHYASPAPPAFDPAGFAARFASLIRNTGLVIHLASVGLVTEGHLLLEDVLGPGKTSRARALASSVESWSRIRFTSDLLPSDVTGVSVFELAQA